MLDIAEGDILVKGADEYPIRSCAEWTWDYGRGSVRRLMRLVVSTKRQPPIVNKQRGPAVTKLTGLRSTPLDPIDPEIRETLALDTPFELLECYIEGGDTFYHLILEDLKHKRG